MLLLLIAAILGRVAGQDWAQGFAERDGSGPTTALDKSMATARPYMGITYVPLNTWAAGQYGPGNDCGVLVTAVALGGPAESAGIQSGDILHSFDGQALTPDVALLDLLWRRQPGNAVSVLGWRDGEHYTVNVVLGER